MTVFISNIVKKLIYKVIILSSKLSTIGYKLMLNNELLKNSLKGSN